MSDPSNPGGGQGGGQGGGLPAFGTAPVAKLPTTTGNPPPPANAPPPSTAIPKPEPIPERPAWSARGAVWLGILSLILFVGGFGAWAAMTSIAGAVVAPGQVEVEQRRQVVQHPEGGVVSEILVREGQQVQADDILIRLDGSLLKTELAIVEGQYFELLARRGRLEAERADSDTITFPPDLIDNAAERPEIQTLMQGQTSLFEARRETLRQAIEQLDKQSEQVAAQINGIDAQSKALRDQRAFIDKELTDQRSLLAKGLAQQPRVLALEREAASLDGELGQMIAARAQAETKRTEIGIVRLQQISERRETAETDLREMGYRELELAERRRSLTDQIARLDIRAPASGIVYELKVTTPHSVIRAAEPVLYIVPQDRPLVISARVAPINVDEVSVGQPVTLRFASFSSRTTPEIDGQVSRISADAVVDEATRIPYYRTEVTLLPDQIDKLGGLQLVPGMPVEVYIRTGERSPIAYLLKPFTDYFVRAFRET
ncbi:HlyD family type I secretion periplasmic adaptor subunit [Paracoccus pacificus]|uniref:Membrane fusion protein (MFP) family protein n=1 Tax=Paracoccus pacificus TaxID=1463598 RepID=A0ABW4R3E6_9RHOB